MGIKFLSVKCPECKASLDFEEGRKYIFCSYCGTKILINNDNEYIFRHIDEASIKQAETDRIVKLKKIEFIEKKRAAAEKMRKRKIKLAVILIIIASLLTLIDLDGRLFSYAPAGVCFFIIMVLEPFSKEDDDDELELEDKAKVPYDIAGYKKMSYAAVEAMFTGIGFINVKCVPLKDLAMGLLKHPGIVESITINGKRVTNGGKKYPINATVVISYHSYR